MTDWEDLKEVQYTVVYNAAGEEIERMEGHVKVAPKDYADRLPIEVHHITVATVQIFKIEK